MRLVITRVLSSAYRGDFAIARAMLAHLHDEKPGWQLTIFCRSPVTDVADLEKFGTVLPELFSDAYGKLRVLTVGLRIFRYILWSGFGIPCLDHAGKVFVDTVSRARALVFCGGGSPGGYGLHNLILHAAVPVIMARKVDVPVIFTGVGSEPDPGALHRTITRWVLNRASLVIARDPSAAQSMKNCGVESPVRVAGDWAFLLPEADAATIEELGYAHKSRMRVGVNLRDPGHAVVGAKRMPPTEMLSKMSAVLQNLLECLEADIIVFSMNKSRATDDFRFACQVRDSLPASLQPRVMLVPTDHSPESIKGFIATLDLFISTRLHPAIFSLSTGVPTLALHHATKVRATMQYFQLSEYFLSIEEASPGAITDKVLEMVAAREEIRYELGTKIPVMRNAARKNLELLAEFLSGTAFNGSL